MELNPTSVTYNNLILAYRFMNQELFDSILPPCLITLQREKRTLGYFSPEKFSHSENKDSRSDEIALNPQYFRLKKRDDRHVISTLVHEMCHLWQHHFGKPGRGRYHNKEWADKMISVGLIPTDTGKKEGKPTGDRITHLIAENGLFTQSFRKLTGRGFRLEWIEYSLEVEEDDLIDTDIHNISDAPDPDEGGEVVDVPELPRKIDKSKIKYSCSECGLNAWAKMGANLICGECKEEMTQIY